MKRLLIILFCLPLIGLGKSTISEVTHVQKKQNLSYFFTSGLGTDIFPSSFHLPQRSFFSYYLTANINYNVSINNTFSIYNNISLPIILRFPKTIEHTSYAYDNTGSMIGLIEYQDSYPTTLITKLEYLAGVQVAMTKRLQSRLGIVMPIIKYPIKYPIVFGDGQGSERQWGGGFNIEFDYSLTKNLCSSLSISHEWINSQFGNELKNSNITAKATEILIGFKIIL